MIFSLMAIEFGHMSIVPAEGGGSIVGLSTYVARDRRVSTIDNVAFDFRHRSSDLRHTQLSLPSSAECLFQTGADLWNAALNREHTVDRKTKTRRFKKRAQVARHCVLALPRELSLAQQISLTNSFFHDNYVSQGVAVEWAIHDDDTGNPHAHALISTRCLSAIGFTAKARHLNPGFATSRVKKNRYVSESDDISARWAEAQNKFFRDHGIDVTVDPKRSISDVHRGPSWHVQDSDRTAKSEAARQNALIVANDPAQVLSGIAQRLSTFTHRDICKFIEKHGLIGSALHKAADAVLAQSDIIELWDPTRPHLPPFYTTAAVRAEEAEIVELAQKLKRGKIRLPTSAIDAASSALTLDHEQREALIHACDSGFSLIIGRAGTGKSRTLAAIAKALLGSGRYHVVGLAPTNGAAISLRSEGISNSSTMHRALWELQNGRQVWDDRTVIMLDEAGIADTVTLLSVMKEAVKAKAHLIMCGDDRQLLSVLRGGMFAHLCSVLESRSIVNVRRQFTSWQRNASRFLAEGDVQSAVDLYARHGRIEWSETADESIERLIQSWSHGGSPKARFIYASTNSAVDRLNAKAQQKRIDRGELHNPTSLPGRGRDIALCVGDRIQFHKNDRKAGIVNGLFGEVHSIFQGTVSVITDSGGFVEFVPSNFAEWSLGYAGTVYRGQGQTRLEVFALHDNAFAWNTRSSYVALTRHRADVRLFVSNEVAIDQTQLISQMSRRTENGPSVAFQQKSLCPPSLSDPSYPSTLATTATLVRRKKSKIRRRLLPTLGMRP